MSASLAVFLVGVVLSLYVVLSIRTVKKTNNIMAVLFGFFSAYFAVFAAAGCFILSAFLYLFT